MLVKVFSILCNEKKFYFCFRIDSNNLRRQAYKGDRSMSPQFSNDSPINYSVESLATSSRPQRQCARFNFCYIDTFSDDEMT